MSIGTIVQRGSFAHVYDERGSLLHAEPCDCVVGFTASSFSIRRGNYIYVYNEHGSLLTTQPC